MKNAFLFLTLLAAISCEMPADKNEATVNQVNGLYVFVYCQPQTSYKVLGSVSGDYLGDMKDATSKDKKFGKRLLGALATTAENIDFQSKLDNMISAAKDEYPNANGIIFEDAMDQAKVVRIE